MAAAEAMLNSRVAARQDRRRWARASMSVDLPVDRTDEAMDGIAMPAHHRAAVRHNGIDSPVPAVLRAIGVAATRGDRNAGAIAMSSPNDRHDGGNNKWMAPVGRVMADHRWTAGVTRAPNTVTVDLIAHADRCSPMAVSMVRAARMASVVLAAGGSANGGAMVEAVVMEAPADRRATVKKAAGI